MRVLVTFGQAELGFMVESKAEQNHDTSGSLPPPLG